MLGPSALAVRQNVKPIEKKDNAVPGPQQSSAAINFELCRRPADALAHDLGDIVAGVLGGKASTCVRAHGETRDRVYLACLHLLLHLAERHLALSLPSEDAAAQAADLANALARLAYRNLYGQDIVPQPAEEYFLTFFLSNYRLFSEHLSLYPLPMKEDGAQGLPPLLDAFGRWLERGFGAGVCGEVLAMRLWEAWPGRQGVD